MNRYFKLSFADYKVGDSTWRASLELWVLYGISPGGFLTALLENNLRDAANKSHPLNKWETIIQVMKWLQHRAPNECWGSKKNLLEWVELSNDQRMEICIKYGLMPSPWELLEENSKWTWEMPDYEF